MLTQEDCGKLIDQVERTRRTLAANYIVASQADAPFPVLSALMDAHEKLLDAKRHLDEHLVRVGGGQPRRGRNRSSRSAM